ncbi:MAG: HNH endonuclease, partial [Desulfobacterales bacterium]|nr:HNH endonuclease [Desulfobacterales bacterium]
MKKCLYTYRVLNRNSPPDDNTESKEHIIPYALGGSNDFVTYDCSKRANNDFGRDIDAPFVALPIVGFKRHEFGIQGQSGNVPPIEMKATVVELNEEGTMVFPHEGKPYVNLPLKPNGSMSEGRIAFNRPPEKVKAAVNGLLKKANRKGFTVLAQDLSPITDSTTCTQSATRQTGQTVQVDMKLGIGNFFEPWA